MSCGALTTGMAYGKAALRLVILAIPATALFGLMQLTAGSVGSEGTNWAFAFKPVWLFRIMNGYHLTVSAATALALMASLYFAAKRGFLKLDPAGIWLAAGFALLYLAIPSTLLGTSFVDLRVIPAAALILPAFCPLSLPSRRWTMAALAAVTGITLANLATVFVVWLSYRADYAAIIDSFHKIDRGSLVLVGGSGEGEDPPFNDLVRYPMAYAPTLAVHYANAFVPSVFTEVGKQPVQARAAIQRLAIPYGGPMPMRVLTAIAAGQTPSGVPPFVRTWPGITIISMCSDRTCRTRCRTCWKNWTAPRALFSIKFTARPEGAPLGRLPLTPAIAGPAKTA